MKYHIIDIEQLTGENFGFRTCTATAETQRKAVRRTTLLNVKVNCFGEIVPCHWPTLQAKVWANQYKLSELCRAQFVVTAENLTHELIAS